ncbi:Serine/threonine-protein phosphatase 6 regulatory ankyrin repeat subunit A [Lachnellula cervina]|uniref:Serine/threonine-protein phosphatase 6 regulatory ankyrin repeat subunit A n=1 Tax=Lachnellula cervina TaxID=1316786 RepID=A0A7D8YRE8_9HELO|nr:Serine/threonine-protein phosphatase 6 regulatory ankyrin repeat subunit A [Lachnellula cervina]
MADDLDDYKLVVSFEDKRVIRHLWYRSDRERGERKVRTEQQWAIEDEPLGSGGFGSVRLQSTADGSKRAVKAVLKSTAEKFNIDYKEEIRALTKFSRAKYSQHGLFVDFLGWYENDDFVFLAMEYLPMGDLSDWAKYSKSEGDLKTICQQLLEGLEIMHANGFMHRDLKPQLITKYKNIFVVQNRPWWVKIGDFGITKRANPEPGITRIGTHIGTEGYSAPEVDPDMAVTLGCSPPTTGKDSFRPYAYTNAVDIWSLGCVLFQLVTHQLPFSPSSPKVLRKFCKGKTPFPGDVLSGKIHQSGLELIQQLLTPKPPLRPSASQALKSSWILEGSVEDVPSVLHSKCASNNSSGQFTTVKIPTLKKSKEQIETPTLLAGARLENDKTTRRSLTPQKSVSLLATSSKLTASSTPGGPTKSVEDKPRKIEHFLEKDISQFTPVGSSYSRLLKRKLHVMSHIKSGNRSTALQDAASRGDERTVKSLLEIGANAIENCQKGCNSLHVAAAFGQEAIIKLLLPFLKNSKGYIDSKDCKGITPLMFAIMSNEDSMVKLLLERGADVAENDDRGFNSLHIAASFGNETILKPLLENSNVDIDSRDMGNGTPLIQATICNKKAMVKLLLQEGANVEAKSNRGYTSIAFAVTNGCEGIVRILFETGKVDVTWKANDGYTLLHFAARQGYDAIVKYLLQTCKVNIDPKDDNYETPLLLASRHGHNSVVQSLLQTGKVDIDAKNTSGCTALMLASIDGHSAVVQLCVENCARLEVKEYEAGRTALHGAALKGHENCVRLLLAKGAKIEAKDKNNYTALIYSACNGHENCVSLLLAKGAKVEVKEDKHGNTALICAAGNGHENSYTPLICAAINGLENCVKLLLAKGAKVEVKDSKGMRPLMLAAEGGDEAIVRLLLKEGAKIGPKDPKR